MVLNVSNAAVKQDPIRILPEEVVLDVFSYFNLASLGTLCLVSKEWKRLANEPILWKKAIYREIAFGNDKWARYCGKNVVKEEDGREEFSSLPWTEFIADCKKFKSVFPGKKAKDYLMLVRLPKTFNGGLTLKILARSAEKYFSLYEYIWAPILNKLGDRSIDKSYWVLMTKDLIPESQNKSYEEQQKIVAGLAEKSLTGYDVPGVLEAAACILSHRLDSNIRLFSDNPPIFTRCKDKVERSQISVGGFMHNHLNIIHGYHCDEGVAALRRL